MSAEYEQTPPCILIVDDKPANIIALEATLEDYNLRTISALSGAEALGYCHENEFACVLLDVQMPEMDGFETAELMRQNTNMANTPIIFITASEASEEHVLKGYNIGAVDYLIKPIDPDVVCKKVATYCELFNKRHAATYNKQLTSANTVLREKNHELDAINLQTEQEKSLSESALAIANQKLDHFLDVDQSTKPLSSVNHEQAPLYERSDNVFSALLIDYCDVLTKYVTSNSTEKIQLKPSLAKIANIIGDHCGTPRDIIEMHLLAVKKQTTTAKKKQEAIFTMEGRLMLLEIMGMLVNYYREKLLSQDN